MSGLLDRRKSERSPVWSDGSYQLVGADGSDWFPCRVLDLAEGGVGLELAGPLPAVGGDILVTIAGGDGPGDLLLFGTVRHQRAGQGRRVGVEVDGLGTHERSTLERVLERHLA